MLDKIVLIFLGILFYTKSYSQQSINAGMVRWQQNENVHQISIGELAIAQTFDQTSIVLTQGYLQPVWKIMSTAQRFIFNDISIHLYPNPVASFLTIELSSNNRIKSIEIMITDIIGHRVYHKKLPSYPASFPYTMDLHALSEGVYTLTTIINNIPHSTILIQKQ